MTKKQHRQPQQQNQQPQQQHQQQIQQQQIQQEREEQKHGGAKRTLPSPRSLVEELEPRTEVSQEPCSWPAPISRPPKRSQLLTPSFHGRTCHSGT